MLLKIRYPTSVIKSEHNDFETEYFTTSDYNKFTGAILNAKIKEKRLVYKSDISWFINKSDLVKKIVKLATNA